MERYHITLKDNIHILKEINPDIKENVVLQQAMMVIKYEI